MESKKCRAVLATEFKKGTLEVVGIFTESDLVKNYRFFRKSENWILPIRTKMSTPIISLQFDQISRVAPLMAKKKIRSVPLLTDADSLTVENICGVVNAFDLVVSAARFEKESNRGRLPVAFLLLSKNRGYAKFLGSLPFGSLTAHMIHVDKPEEFQLHVEALLGKSAMYFIDADHFEPETVIGLLAIIAKAGLSKRTAVLFDEIFSAEKVALISETSEEIGGDFNLLRKPLDPFAFMEFVEGMFPGP